ncbi:DUF4931 domain-containing protein [archaeon]|nr:DUF4931 domain-containing protein [archaeon]
MNELRKDYILDRWVIIAANRGKRPDHFKNDIEEEDNPDKCFLCPSKENLTPSEIERVEENGHWVIRDIPNKYVAAERVGDPKIRTDNTFFTYASAYGSHEVVVETDIHSQQMQDFTVDHMKKLFHTYIDRIKALYKEDNIKYVSIFKNYGHDAGASVKHSHSQIIGYNLVPTTIKNIVEKSAIHIAGKGTCPYCDIIDIEKKSYRAVEDSKSFVSFTPYASRFPFEVWIFPKRHVSSIEELDDDELSGLAAHLQKRIRSLMSLGHISYNFEMFSYRPGMGDFHFHIVITPRLAKWAGFELATATIINVMPPETAAEFYRNN